MVNGPEVLNKYVGASEENIRKLFADAEAEQAARGDASDLHVIIFDEIDAICKSRGSVQCALTDKATCARPCGSQLFARQTVAAICKFLQCNLGGIDWTVWQLHC